MSDAPATLEASPRVAVAIPCYNEAAAIGDLVAEWRQVLPEADIFVFDNNSTDATALVAAAAGAMVVLVSRQGKGHVVQEIFQRLRARPAVILTDGDATYPPSAAPKLLVPVVAGKAEMVVGARKPIDAEGTSAMKPIRGLGNWLLRAAFRLFIGRGPGDLLSGYRVFSPRFISEVTPRSSGFEIETELTGEAVARGHRVVEVEVAYHPRALGTVSKLRAGPDGLRILWTILKLSARLRPWALAGWIFVVGVLVGVIVKALRDSGIIGRFG